MEFLDACHQVNFPSVVPLQIYAWRNINDSEYECVNKPLQYLCVWEFEYIHCIAVSIAK